MYVFCFRLILLRICLFVHRGWSQWGCCASREIWILCSLFNAYLNVIVYVLHKWTKNQCYRYSRTLLLEDSSQNNGILPMITHSNWWQFRNALQRSWCYQKNRWGDAHLQVGDPCAAAHQERSLPLAGHLDCKLYPDLLWEEKQQLSDHLTYFKTPQFVFGCTWSMYWAIYSTEHWMKCSITCSVGLVNHRLDYSPPCIDEPGKKEQRLVNPWWT